MTGGRQKMTADRGQKAAPSSVSRLPFSALLLALCLCILALRVTYTEAPTAQTHVMPGILADTVYSLTLSGLLIFAFVLWLVWSIVTGRRAYRVTGMEVGLALFGIAAVLSSIRASDTRSAITQTLVLLGPICAALLLVQILDSPGRVRLVLTVIAALGVVSAYQCAEQFFVSNAAMIEQYEKSPETLLNPLGVEPGTFQHFMFEHRLYSRGIRGFFTTSNSAASFAIMASFAGLALLLRLFHDAGSDRPLLRRGLPAAFGTILVVAGLLLTQSKGGILAFFAGLMIFGLLMGVNTWLGARRRRVLAIAVPGALLLAIALGCLAVLYGLQHDRLPGGNSMLVRWQYWTASARMYADHPWTGVGPGNFSNYYPHYKPPAALESVSDPHNFLLSLLTQYGPLGLLGFLAMLAVPLWRSVMYCPADSPSESARQQAPFRAAAFGMLLVISACLLVIRPLLIPMTGDGDFTMAFYEVMTLYVTPAAAFLIGFLLLAAPLDDKCAWQSVRALTGLCTALAAAVLGVLLHNLIDFAIFEPGVWMTLWILLACLVASRLPPRAVTATASPRSPALKMAVLAGAALLLGGYYFYAWRPVCRATVGIRRAQDAVARGQFDLAHHYLDAAAAADPLAPVAANLNGRLYVQQYEMTGGSSPALLEKAARSFREVIAANPADYKNYENLAMVYNQLGQPAQAYDWFLKAVARYPGRGRLWFELANTAERLDRPGAALDHYRKAVAIEDSYRRQFRTMYPDREKTVSRLGEQDYEQARRRIEELAGSLQEGK